MKGGGQKGIIFVYGLIQPREEPRVDWSAVESGVDGEGGAMRGTLKHTGGTLMGDTPRSVLQGPSRVDGQP